MRFTYLSFLLFYFSSCSNSEKIKELVNEVEISNHYYIDISIDSFGTVRLNDKKIITDTLDIAFYKLSNKAEIEEKEVVINFKVDENTSMKIVTDVKLKIREAGLMK